MMDARGALTVSSRDRLLRASQPATRTMCLHALCAHFTFVWSNDTLASQNITHEHKTAVSAAKQINAMHNMNLSRYMCLKKTFH
jgi:hypothetical protein